MMILIQIRVQLEDDSEVIKYSLKTLRKATEENIKDLITLTKTYGIIKLINGTKALAISSIDQ